MVAPVAAPAPRADAAPGRGPGTRPWLAWLVVVPFLVYVGVFLVYPTGVVLAGAFQDADGAFTLENLAALGEGVHRQAFLRSVELSAWTALLGAVFGALLSWAVSVGRPDGLPRRVVVAGSGVLAQFGGVPLAFAFLATVGFQGFVTRLLKDVFGLDLFAGGAWLFEMPGLVLVYTFFQVPLMVIVFLPALDGLRPQWREAVDGLGGTAWTYWRHVGGPVLLPAFLGALLLLFANAFSAYATAAALVSQGSPIVPLQIRGALTGEVLLGQENVGKALGLGMVVVVAVAMSLYALLHRRFARWQ
ncbi:ABC transporter permease [Saccharothrix australiensis]|uniref:Putative spermidine/putrescine transport system permease protein n=1 Tax=Saccharothrix australiensis TaxID=2072 RepID=A0A495W3K1_9PSEU|nr:ABC transporter permease [Saccharothrix australiensis]RKT56069.1 putative spermidine/putrescine transport system permease protein [Saccharothrix australiensis]